jgi:hypothetical protein
MRTTFRAAAAALLAAGLIVLVGSPAGAKHAGESITVSKTTGLVDGDTVQVTVSGFAPNAKPVKLVIAGQGDLVTIPDKLNFDEYAVAPEVPIAADGSGSAELIVTADHGTVQDGSTLDCSTARCWIIAVQEPFLPQPNYASQEIFFGSNGPATTTTAAPAETTTTAAATTTEAPTTTSEVTETEDEIDTEETAAVEDDDTGGSNGLLIAIIAVVVVAVGVGGYFLTKKKPAAG